MKVANKNGKNGTEAHPPVSDADLESAAGDELLGAEKGTRLDPRRSIIVHSRRKRLCDPDNISAKAAIDGLVRGGIFVDDSTKEIKEVRYSQEKAKEEETIIEVWEV